MLVSKVAPRSLKQLRGRVGWKCRILCLFPDVLAQVPLPRTLFVAGFTAGTYRDVHGTCIYAPLHRPCFHRPRLVCQSVSVRGLGGAVRLPRNYAVLCVRRETQFCAWTDSPWSAPSPFQGSPRADVVLRQLRPTETWAVLCGSHPFPLFSRFHGGLPVGHRLINYVLLVTPF